MGRAEGRGQAYLEKKGGQEAWAWPKDHMVTPQLSASEGPEPSTQEPAFHLVMEFATPCVWYRINRRQRGPMGLLPVTIIVPITGVLSITPNPPLDRIN